MEEEKKEKKASPIAAIIIFVLIIAIAVFGTMYQDQLFLKLREITEKPFNAENSQYIGTWQTMTWVSSRGDEYAGNDKTNDGSVIVLNPDGTYTSKWYGAGKWWETETGIKLRASDKTEYVNFTFKEGYILDNDAETTLYYTYAPPSEEKYGDPYIKIK